MDEAYILTMLLNRLPKEDRDRLMSNNRFDSREMIIDAINIFGEKIKELEKIHSELEG